MMHPRANKIMLPLVWLLLVAVLGLKPALAQIDAGGITGVVKDPSGAIVAGAMITLRNDLTGISSIAKSTSAGTYTFTGINPGTYTMTTSLAGLIPVKV